MSCFSGKIKEYPSFSVDSFIKENLESKAFFLSHCHKDHMEGLDSSAFANKIKHSSDIFIYCSETTLNLLLCNPAYTHLKNYLKGVPIDQPYLVMIKDEDTRQNEAVTVTLLSAGHCVGSVMFLFEGMNGNVLYTGDFRISKGDAQRIKFFHSNGCVKDIKSIYVDTTFCLPQMMSIPSRKDTKDAVIRLIDKWLSKGFNHMVSLQCKAMYGYEYLLKEIAQHYKTKIHISKERLALYHYLIDMKQHFTTDPKETRIHSCKWDKTPKDAQSSLPCGFILPNGDVPKIIQIKPTSMWFARHTEPLPVNSTRYIKDKRTWRIVHSMHASMEEIIDLVDYLKPYHVYPNVEPAGLYSLDDAANWLKEFTRIDECVSCNIDHGHAHFKAQAKGFQKPIQGKAFSFPSKQRAPSRSVTTIYKELGLEETSLTPIPIKRRRRIQHTSSNTNVFKRTDSLVQNTINSDSGFEIGNDRKGSQTKDLVIEQSCLEIGDRVIAGAGGDVKVKPSNSNRELEALIGCAKLQCETQSSPLGKRLAHKTRNISKVQDDPHECILTKDTESNTGENSVPDDAFNIPASPDTRLPSGKSLIDLYKRIGKGT